MAAIMAVSTVTRSTLPSASAQSSAATTTRSTHNPKKFALADAGNPAATHAAPAIFNASRTDTTTSGTGMTAAGAIITVTMVAVAAATYVTKNPNPPQAPPLDWSDTPFDVGIHLDMESPAMPLCHDKGEISSDDENSIFVDLSRD
jgi:hypothetical protein